MASVKFFLDVCQVVVHDGRNLQEDAMFQIMPKRHWPQAVFIMDTREWLRMTWDLATQAINERTGHARKKDGEQKETRPGHS